MKEKKSIYIICIIGIVIISLFLLSYNLKLKEDEEIINIQTEFEHFVDKACNTGKITNDDYNNLMSKLNSSGNSYELSIGIQHMDNDKLNKNNKEDTQIGENTFYDTYTEQMLNSLNNQGEYLLNEGDVIQIKIIKSESQEIVAQQSGMVIVNGN